LLLDGSMGAFIYARKPQEEDYRGTRFRNHPKPLKNCTEAAGADAAKADRTASIVPILDAGADIIETCTFNATPLALTSWPARACRRDQQDGRRDRPPRRG